MRALIIMPTYNEADNIRPILEEIFKLHSDKELEVLVVDDASPDGTGQIAEEYKKSQPKVHILHRSGKLGLGKAYVAGFRWGLEKDYDVFIMMDADFSHHPKYLTQMLETLNEADVAIGSRYVPTGGTVNWGITRKIISRGGSLYARTILGIGLRDCTGGFNGWKRKVLETLGLDTMETTGYSFHIELKHRALVGGFKVKEFPIIFEDRQVGKSKMSSHIFIEAMKQVWKFRFKYGSLAAAKRKASRLESRSTP